MVAQSQQPLLHDLVVAVAAPAVALSGTDGQVRPQGAQGVFVADRRVCSRLEVLVDGRPATPLRGVEDGGPEAHFVGVLRDLGDPGADPTVVIERHRRVCPDGLVEGLTLRSAATVAVTGTLTVRVGCDLAALAAVKAGGSGEPLPAVLAPGGLRWAGPDGADPDTEVALTADPPPERRDAVAGELSWTVRLPPGAGWQLRLRLSATGGALGPLPLRPPPAGAPLPWSTPTVRCGDWRLPALLDRSLADLAGLLLTDPQQPADRFLAAGAPWFLTLFGRDSLWAARMLLPLGTRLAGGTLRTLARRQGRRDDPDTEEQPGKILHEVRPEVPAAGDLRLPPVYYGTIDATPLWISLLADAWRFGLPEPEVLALLPHLERALAWLRDGGDVDGDGFLEYVDRSGHGLANQGWKDSGDSVQWADGRLARSPIALCEVQGYAHRAARDGADLLAAFGRPDASAWRSWADALAARFRARFWVDGPEGGYPAMALDADKRPVDAVASNMGHLLGTGLLGPDDEAAVARRLGAADLDSGFGLRTLTARSPRFNPLGYHAGSVWPHDTVIAVAGLARAGHPEVAGRLAAGLVAAAPAFGWRLPELYGGAGPEPLPYPAACRPQAWAAAAAVALLEALTGVAPDVPRGVLHLRPLPGLPFGPWEVRGLHLAGHELALRWDGHALDVLAAPPQLRVTVDGAPGG